MPKSNFTQAQKKNLLPTDMLGLRHANLYFKSNLREKQRDHPYKSETPCNFLETLGLEKKKKNPNLQLLNKIISFKTIVKVRKETLIERKPRKSPGIEEKKTLI